MNVDLGKTPFGVLFVCTANICRSPTAEAIFTALAARSGLQRYIRADSAGTQGFHVGSPPDARSVKAARVRGYDLRALRARQFDLPDFRRFEWIIAMDHEHRSFISGMATPEQRQRIKMMMDFATKHRIAEVPDPYYGGTEGFELVLDMLEDACRGLLETVSGLISRPTEAP